MASLRRFCCLLFLCTLPVVLAACGNLLTNQDPPGEPTAPPTTIATPEPVELDTALRVEQSGFALRYPGAWVTRELSNTLTLAARSEALDATSPGNTLVLSIDSTPLETLAESYSADAVADLEGVFDISTTILQDAGYTLGEPQPVTLDGQEGLASDLSATGGAGRMIVLRVPPQRVRIIGQAAPEAWAAQQALFEEIVASITFFAPDDAPTPTPQDVARQPELSTEGPVNFVLRLGGNEGMLNERFVSARGLVVDANGTLYVAESSRGIWVFASDGTLQKTFGEADLIDAYDVTIGAGGDLFVADYGRNDIARFSPDGQLRDRWGEVGDEASQFGLLSPQRIASGPDGSIYALDSRVSAEGEELGSGVLRFSGSDGSFIERIPLPAGAAPNDIAVDNSGNLYIAEAVNRTVTRIDREGQVVATFGSNVLEEGITAGALDIDEQGVLYVATWNTGILAIAPTGSLLDTLGAIAETGTIPQPGEFSLPNGLAIAPNDIVWVSDNDGEYSAITALRANIDATAAVTSTNQNQASVAPQTTPLPEEQLVRQWASEARASSQYDASYGPDGAVGPPDVDVCMSSPDAWASATPDGVDTLSVAFAQPVFASGMRIHQNHQPGFVSRIDLFDTQGGVTQVYSGTTELQDTCPLVLDVSFEPTLSRVVSATITVDQRNGAQWSEIDAVELLGLE
jgi:sugar lactone lactonase YvrE